MDIRSRTIATVLMCLLWAGYVFPQADNDPDEDTESKQSSYGREPDYMKGEQIIGRKGAELHCNYAALGSTGIIGNFWARRGAVATKDTRMIQVREVLDGTPASGKIQEGDVIVGLGSDKFKSDARLAISAALTDAEKQENGGKLVLNVWSKRTKKTAPVTLVIPVMGTYSATSPWDCPKTDKIINKAADWLADNMPGGITGNIAALGLLATGEKKYERVVSELARKAAKNPGGGHGARDTNSS